MITGIDFISLAEEYEKYIKKEMDNEELVNRLYDKYNGLIDKEYIYELYRAIKTTYGNYKITIGLLEEKLDELYKKTAYLKGTCKLIHIGKRRVVDII